MGELVSRVTVSLIRWRTGRDGHGLAAPPPVARPLSLLGGCSGHTWGVDLGSTLRVEEKGEEEEEEEEEDLAGRI